MARNSSVARLGLLALLGCGVSEEPALLSPEDLCDGTDEVRLSAAVSTSQETLLTAFSNSEGAPRLVIKGTCEYAVSGSAWGLTKVGVLQGELRDETLEALQYQELGRLSGEWGEGCYDPPLLRVTAGSNVVDCYCFCERNAPAKARALGANFDAVIENLQDEGTYWSGPLRILAVRQPQRDGEPDTLVPWPLQLELAEIAFESSEFWNDGELREELLEGHLIDDREDVDTLRTTLQETVDRRQGGVLTVHDEEGLAYGLLGRDELD